MAAGIVVARIAGPSVVGVLAYGTAYVSILGFINGLFGSAHIKLVSEGRDHAECMAVYTRLQAASMIVYFIATAGWFLIQKYLLHYQFESRQVQIVIVITLFAHFINEYLQYTTTVYTANLKQAKANLPGFFRNLAWHVGRVVIVILGYRAIALSLWNLLLAVALVPFLYKLLKEYPLGKYNSSLAKEYFRYAIPILIIVIVNSVTHYADRLLLAHFTDTTQLGYYSAAYSIGGMFMLIAGPVGQIFFPLFSGMIAKGNWQGVSSNIVRYQEFIALFVFPLVCLLSIIGKPVLIMVLGNRYQPSIMPFIILLYATYIVLWGMPYSNIISGMGRFYTAALINGIKLAVFVVSITVFVSPKFLDLKASGVAINQFVINLIGNGMILYFAKKHGSIHLGFKNHLRHLTIIAISVVMFFLARWMQAQTDLWWLIILPLYLVIVYAILSISRLIGKEQWSLLLEAVNIRKVINYANDEMRGK
jgi:O-antigen/teichoic acid export membrane protein